MGEFAWVTLVTNDSYGLGALVLAHTLRQVGTPYDLVILVTPGVSPTMKQKLSAIFNEVKEVDILDSRDELNLQLLQRPELGVTFTKLHCWKLTQYKKCVFLDADTMVVDNVDELFEREELSAAPDVGWPDCFNTGVFVFQPSEDTFAKLIDFTIQTGSFDGGDQGLLNLYFSDWAQGDIRKHLPFIYNICSTACYSYLPAFKQFGGNAKIIHFIGKSKPWLQYFDTKTRQVVVPQEMIHLQPILQKWWDIFCFLVHPTLSSDMTGMAAALGELQLGVARTTLQSELDDHLRRQCWEVGNIDYLGRDSFEHIWSKICQTISGSTPPAQLEVFSTQSARDAEGLQHEVPTNDPENRESEPEAKKLEIVEQEDKVVVDTKVKHDAVPLSTNIANKDTQDHCPTLVTAVETPEDAIVESTALPPGSCPIVSSSVSAHSTAAKKDTPTALLSDPKPYDSEVKLLPTESSDVSTPTSEICNLPQQLCAKFDVKSSDLNIIKATETVIDASTEKIISLPVGHQPVAAETKGPVALPKDNPTTLMKSTVPSEIIHTSEVPIEMIPILSQDIDTGKETVHTLSKEAFVETSTVPVLKNIPTLSKETAASTKESVPSLSKETVVETPTTSPKEIPPSTKKTDPSLSKETVEATPTIPVLAKTPTLPKETVRSTKEPVATLSKETVEATPTVPILKKTSTSPKEVVPSTTKSKPEVSDDKSSSSSVKTVKSESTKTASTQPTTAPVAPPRKIVTGDKKKSGKGKK